MKTRGVAVLGCGTIGEFHVGALRDIPRARLVGVSSRRADKARAIGDREGCRGTADPRELLADSEVDLVIVATSSGSHAALAMEALDAGKHVLVEKPMAMTAAEAARVIRKARERKRLLSVVSQRRFEEPHVLIRRVLEEGRLGRLLHIEAACPFYRTQEYYASAEWRGTRSQDGGALMNQAIHSVDLVLWMAGPAESVFGKTATRTHRMEAEDLAVALATFRSGAFGTILASTSIQPGFLPTLFVYGEKGTVKVEGTVITHWSVPGVERPDSGAAQTSGGGAQDPRSISALYHRRQIEDVLEAIDREREPAVTGEDGRRAVAFVEGVYRSAAEGRPVGLENE